MENLYLNDALQNYLDNGGYLDKIVIEYFAYILDFIIPKMLCLINCIFCIVYNNIWRFTIIMIYKIHYLYLDNELIITIIFI